MLCLRRTSRDRASCPCKKYNSSTRIVPLGRAAGVPAASFSPRAPSCSAMVGHGAAAHGACVTSSSYAGKRESVRTCQASVSGARSRPAARAPPDTCYARHSGPTAATALLPPPLPPSPPLCAAACAPPPRASGGAAPSRAPTTPPRPAARGHHTRRIRAAPTPPPPPRARCRCRWAPVSPHSVNIHTHACT